MSEIFSELQGAEFERRQQDTNASEAIAARRLDGERGRFFALEERIVRAVELVKRERQARIAAEERAAHMEAQLQRTGAAHRTVGKGTARAARASATMCGSASSGCWGNWTHSRSS